eukprot:2908745-Rhodomonas_salina.4
MLGLAGRQSGGNVKELASFVAAMPRAFLCILLPDALLPFSTVSFPFIHSSIHASCLQARSGSTWVPRSPWRTSSSMSSMSVRRY